MLNDQMTLLLIREWVQKAENDLKNAAFTVKMGRECPTDTVVFHAQQCAEKYLKACLVAGGIEFPRTHDIGMLISLLPKVAAPNLSIEEQRRLTDYATITRYPGDYERVALAEARHAIAQARVIRKKIRSILPKEALADTRNLSRRRRQ